MAILPKITRPDVIHRAALKLGKSHLLGIHAGTMPNGERRVSLRIPGVPSRGTNGVRCLLGCFPSALPGASLRSWSILGDGTNIGIICPPDTLEVSEYFKVAYDSIAFQVNAFQGFTVTDSKDIVQSAITMELSFHLFANLTVPNYAMCR
jgi:hypothetical protein